LLNWRLLAGVVAGCAVSIGGFLLARRDDERVQQQQFSKRTADAGAAVITAFSVPAEVAMALPAFLQTHNPMDAATFAQFTEPTVERHKGIAALEWMPRVKHEDRLQFEEQNRLRIVEPDDRGNMIAAKPRDNYFPIQLMTPHVPGIIGLDINFEPQRAARINETVNSGKPYLSSRFRLVEDPEWIFSVALYAPVFTGREHTSGFAHLRGVTVSLFRLRPIVEHALKGVSLEHTYVELEDLTAEPSARVLYQSGDQQASEGLLHSQQEFDYINRRWRINWSGTYDPNYRRNAPYVLGAGLGLTLIGALAALALERMRRLDKQVLAAKTLGNYTLLQKLGEGGMGSVYLARHALLRRPTAVKVIRLASGVPDIEAEARFEREVQCTAQLTHPNTIAVFDYGRSGEGQFYYAMEYLKGLSLETIVGATGAMPQNRAVHLIKQACGSLAEAHAVNLVHRDIKPDNIMVCERGGVPDFVKVLDFGLVKSLQRRDPALSRTGGILGTPGYIAPETLINGTIDSRSDVYALGAVLYFLITGTKAFDADNPAALATRALSEPPPAPSERTSTAIDPALDALIVRCLGPSPRRPTDASALLQELERLELLQWTLEDAKTWWRDVGHRVLVDHGGPDPSIGSSETLLVDLSAQERAKRRREPKAG
jgi:CHASE1-domain containing sensor protein